MDNGEVKNIAGVPVIENKYLPENTVLVMGNHCRYCHMKFSSVWDACFGNNILDAQRKVKL